MTADDTTISQLPGQLPPDVKINANGEEEPSTANHVPTSHSNGMEAAACNDTPELSDSGIEPLEERSPILRVTNPDPSSDEEHQSEDSAANIPIKGGRKSDNKRKWSNSSPKGSHLEMVSSITPLCKKTEKDKSATNDEKLKPNERTEKQPPCCEWCLDPERSKAPAKLLTYNPPVPSTVRELERNDLSDMDARERSLDAVRAYEYRYELKRRTGGEPSNSRDDPTANFRPVWGYQYPDPAPSQEAGPAETARSAVMSLSRASDERRESGDSWEILRIGQLRNQRAMEGKETMPWAEHMEDIEDVDEEGRISSYEQVRGMERLKGLTRLKFWNKP